MLMLFERSIGIIVRERMRMYHHHSVNDMPVPVVQVNRKVKTQQQDHQGTDEKLHDCCCRSDAVHGAKVDRFCKVHNSQKWVFSSIMNMVS